MKVKKKTEIHNNPDKTELEMAVAVEEKSKFIHDPPACKKHLIFLENNSWIKWIVRTKSKKLVPDNRNA